MLQRHRMIVEDYLSALCQSLETLETINDPYPPDEDEQQRILDMADGLISYVQYEPGTPEWENFEPEGWLSSTPTDAQVEKLYPSAEKYFKQE